MAGEDLAAGDDGAARPSGRTRASARPTSSWMRTVGMTVPSSPAIWRRTALTRLQQRAAGRRVDEVHEAEADRRARAGRSAARRAPGRPGWTARAARPAAPRPSAFSAASASSVFSIRPTMMNTAPTTRNGSLGRPGTSAKAQMTTPATIGALRCFMSWPATSEPRSDSEALRVTMMPDGDGDEQRRDLGGEAVADGQQREVLGGLADRHPLLHDADDDAADEVDRRDDDRRPWRRP